MEEKVYKIGAIGFAHTHMMANLKSFADCGKRVEMKAAADITPRTESLLHTPASRNGDIKAAVSLYGMKHYEDYHKMLEEEELDIVLVCAENACHPAVAERALRKGIHVVLEKPMAADFAGGARMARAAEVSGAEIMVNWPSTWSSAMRYAKELCAEGKIGKVFKLTYRNAESLGPLEYGQNADEFAKSMEWWHQSGMGGGAMLDYCCYGANLAAWFLGTPLSAAGYKANFNSKYGSAEDNAAIIARFADAVAIMEGSWTTVNTGEVPAGPVLFGTEGTMVVRLDGKIGIYKTPHQLQADEILTPPELPEERNSLGKEVLYHLDTGSPIHPTMSLELNLRAMGILDAGAKSAYSGKAQWIPDRTWCTEENTADK